MSELLKAFSSYHVFNYLLPGIVFSVIASEFLGYPIGKHDIVSTIFLYYFVGLVISRFGSLVIEPILKWLRIVHFIKYPAFLAAEKNDEKLATISEVNNTYRTFCGVFTLLLVVRVYAKFENKVPAIRPWGITGLTVLLLVMFVFSYRKQTKYLVQRVKATE